MNVPLGNTLSTTLSPMVLNARAGIGWSSGSHTALPTFTTAKGVGAEILLGMTENTDLGRRMKGLLEK